MLSAVGANEFASVRPAPRANRADVPAAWPLAVEGPIKLHGTKSAEAIKFMLRVPPPLMKQVQKRAEQNNTSVTQEIINMLQDHDARQIAQAVVLFEPMIKSAVRSAARVAADMVLAALKDAVKPTETEVERRLSQLQEVLARSQPNEGGEK